MRGKFVATIDFEIAAHVTKQGEVRISGSSSGGDALFDEALDLGAMIDALSEKHEHSADHRLSLEGRIHMGALAETLADASEDLRIRLTQDDLLKAQADFGGHKDSDRDAAVRKPCIE